MKSLRRAGRLCAAMQVGFALGFMFVATGRGQEAAGFTEVTPNVLVFATRTGNVVALVGPDGALLIGTPSADSTERISSELAKRTKIGRASCRERGESEGVRRRAVQERVRRYADRAGPLHG